MPYKRLSIAWCSCKRRDGFRESPFLVKLGTTLENTVRLLRKQNAGRADPGLSEYLHQREPIFWGKDDRRWSLVKGFITTTLKPASGKKSIPSMMLSWTKSTAFCAYVMPKSRTFHDMRVPGVIRDPRSRKMKEKKQTETETKTANTNNQREARVSQSQGPSGGGLAGCIFSYRLAWSR